MKIVALKAFFNATHVGENLLYPGQIVFAHTLDI